VENHFICSIIPSKDTYRRVFSVLNPEEFNKRFFEWVTLINPKIEQEIISIDGKTLRRSHNSALNQSAIHIAAYRPQPNQLSLKIFSKSEDFKT